MPRATCWCASATWPDLLTVAFDGEVREIALEQGRLDEVFRQITTSSKEAA